MGLLPINMGERPNEARLRAALDNLPAAAPVVVMIHGFRFSPHVPAHDPHRHILSVRPEIACWKAVSWPRHLGLAGDAGLAIAFGWPARGTIWQAMARTAPAAAELAALVLLLRRIAPARPVHLIGHSLGARIALMTCAAVPAGAIERVILISAALFRAEALQALSRPGAARSAELINVSGRENLLFDMLLRLCLPTGGPTIGAGIEAANWLDLRLDSPHALQALARFGYRIPPPRAAICHWSGYLRPGVFRLYRDLLLAPAQLPLPVLRAALARPAQSRETPLPLWQDRAS